jgi:hypothetical protein
MVNSISLRSIFYSDRSTKHGHARTHARTHTHTHTHTHARARARAGTNTPRRAQTKKKPIVQQRLPTGPREQTIVLNHVERKRIDVAKEEGQAIGGWRCAPAEVGMGQT